MSITMRNRPVRVNKIRVRRGKLEKREARTGLIFMIPWLIGAAIFLVYPIVTSLLYAVSDVKADGLRGGMSVTFLGANWNANFAGAFANNGFIQGLVNYLIETVISVPVIVVFALIIAMMLNQKIRGRTFFRLIFFLPVIIVSGPVLSLLTSDNAGSLTVMDTQTVTAAISSVLPEAIAGPISNLFASMVTILWYAGVPILIFLSALQKVDKAQYEAAYVDGASPWEMFWKITLPALKPMILLNCIYTIVFVSSNDQNALILLIRETMIGGADSAGPDVAAAMAWIYAVAVLILCAVFAVVFMTHKDKYEKEARQTDRRMKRERRKVLRIQRRQARHAKKYDRPTVR